jgi:hypothetical protein
VIVVPPEERAFLKSTRLKDFYFNWPFLWGNDGSPALALPLGYGMLYNHSDSPNALLRFSARDGTIDFIAKVDIAVGEEITHHYAGIPNSSTTRQFESEPAMPAAPPDSSQDDVSPRSASMPESK